MVCVYCFGDVSGAHLNPAVSIAHGLAGRKSWKGKWKEVGIYCGVQILAGLMAGFSYGLVLWEVFTLEPGRRTTSEAYRWWELGLAEMLYTALLCFVALQVSPKDQPALLDQQTRTYNNVYGNQYYGIAVGFVFLAAVPGAGHLTGAGFCPLNPAIALGIDMSSMLQGFYWWICYTAFELMGACLGAFLFKLTDVLDVTNRLGSEIQLKPKLIAEGVGSFFLVLTAGLNVIGGSNAPVFSIAAVLMVLIFALGHVSGGHFNPAVTLAVLLRGGYIVSSDAACYMVAQFVGGIVGGLTYSMLEHGRTFPLNIGDGFGWSQVAVAEIVFTFVLCYVVLAVACVRQEKKLKQLFGFAIGSCVTAGGIAIGNISGGVLNPAVAFSVALASLFSGGNFWHFLPYMCFQFVGAALAAGVFVLTRPSEYAKTVG
mmetsp:Transcript_145525/g.267457  ORF Transcript_145525/g.267457 Transcript_145525/m.267457 type:complete len:427 (-) Transcript_145525:121-1401(-)